MRRLTSAILVISLAILLPCVANGEGTDGAKGSAVSLAAPTRAMSAVARTPRPIETPGEIEVDSLQARTCVDLKSVQSPGDLSNILSPGPSPDGYNPSLYYYYTVPGVNFQPKDASTNVVYGGSGCVYTTNSGQMIAQLVLPDNAIIRYLRLWYYRTTASGSTMVLTKYDPAVPATTDIFNVSANTTTGAGTVLSAFQSETVDFITKGYNAIWLNTGVSTNMLCGVRVAYTMPATGTYTPITPCRLINTLGADAPNLTSTARNFQITGGCGVPTGATAVTANVTTLQGTGSGYLAIWPQGTAWPGNSTVNYTAGAIVANAADLALSATGQVSAKVQDGQTAALILDITGYFY